jgi:hypothetical protein
VSAMKLHMPQSGRHTYANRTSEAGLEQRCLQLWGSSLAHRRAPPLQWPGNAAQQGAADARTRA